MRRVLLALAPAGLVALAGLWAARGTSNGAGKAPRGPTPAVPSPMPITHVTLFSSGVGQFVRQGTVTGDGRLDLTFPVGDVNDLLKSLKVEDLDGGRVRAVGLDSEGPVDRALRSYAINLADNPSLAAVLNRARGEGVEVVAGGPAPVTLSGTIVGVEKKKLPAGKGDMAEVEQLNLWCRDGLRSVKLGDVQRLSFLNPAVKEDLKQALGVLARGHDNRKKTITLVCAGEGRRRVRADYVVEHPLWKTTYRLDLGKGGDFALQGWAMVENPSDENWDNVQLALIAGRPVSFRMDLYQAIYVPRPLVELDLFAGLRPPTYGGALDWRLEKGRFTRPAPKLEELRSALDTEPRVRALPLGDFYQYLLDERVSLARQKSALFPVVRKGVRGRRVSIYNEGVLARHPMLGLRLKNTTGLHLMQGPLTVYEGATYAGDVKLPDLQPNEERLFAYAIDLGTEVSAERPTSGQRLVSVKVDRGVLLATSKLRETKIYRIRNRSPQERVVIVEHPYRADFVLADGLKAAERSRDVYRFEVKVAAGATAELTVTEEKPLGTTVRLLGSGDDVFRFYANVPAASPALKAALGKAMELRGRVVETERALARTTGQLELLIADQKRLRDNMARVPPTSEAYKRYLAKLEQQEGQIERLQEAMKKLQEGRDAQQKELEAYLGGLSVE